MISETFLIQATDVLGDTQNGLTGSEIAKYCLAFANEFNVDIAYPRLTPFPADLSNKRTALLENLKRFSAEQQFGIINELCELDKFKNNIAAKELKQKLNEKYGSLNIGKSNSETKVDMTYKKYETSTKEKTPSQKMIKQNKFIIPNPINIFLAWYKSKNINPEITAAWVREVVAGIFKIAASLLIIFLGKEVYTQYYSHSGEKSSSSQTVQKSTVEGDMVGRDKITIQTAPTPKVEDIQTQVKVSKVKINRILEDLSFSLEEIRKEYLKESERTAGDFNSRNMLTSGVFVKTQMDLATNTKEKIEKLFTKAHRDIQDITLENFKATNLDEIPEFSEEQKILLEIEKKTSEIYGQLEEAVKSWEMKALKTTQLTKDFKL